MELCQNIRFQWTAVVFNMFRKMHLFVYWAKNPQKWSRKVISHDISKNLGRSLFDTQRPSKSPSRWSRNFWVCARKNSVRVPELLTCPVKTTCERENNCRFCKVLCFIMSFTNSGLGWVFVDHLALKLIFEPQTNMFPCFKMKRLGSNIGFHEVPGAIHENRDVTRRDVNETVGKDPVENPQRCITLGPKNNLIRKNMFWYVLIYVGIDNWEAWDNKLCPVCRPFWDYRSSCSPCYLPLPIAI